MTPGAAAALALPTTGSWDFSDYPYGLEPLTLPHPGEPYATGGCVGPADVTRVCEALHTRADEGFEITRPAVGHTLERLFWFRWITGHQISFVIWRLLADALARLSAGEGDREELSAEIAQHVRGYCGMLLYTGSCDRAVYNGTIRPSMYRLHSTFTGTWAPDYPPVRSLFRGRKVPPVSASQADALVREVRLSSQIHLGVASKLVTGGRSLLQRTVAERDTAQPRMWGAVFDCYFLTLRAPVSSSEVASQLLRRQKAVAMDLAANGLYPAAGADEIPEELRQPDVLACEEDLTDALFRIARLAAGLPLDRARAAAR
ncbi:hypothetical protein ACPEIF_30045 [Streptomyces sp. NPDC012600]|uniref:hypothetical protein n=1 Tax=Streptomyces sp. NPDC012600 TaxID=3415005 RepID=UPI003C2C0B69